MPYQYSGSASIRCSECQKPITSGYKHRPGDALFYNHTQVTCSPACARRRKTRLQRARRLATGLLAREP